jgi:hypothetical protein
MAVCSCIEAVYFGGLELLLMGVYKLFTFVVIHKSFNLWMVVYFMDGSSYRCCLLYGW